MILMTSNKLPLTARQHASAEAGRPSAAALKVLCSAWMGLAFAGPSLAASFDCTGAAQPIEKQICSSERLSSLDDAMARAYVRAKQSHPDPDRLRAEQRTWLRTRNACPDDGCRVDAYEIRIDALKALESATRATSSKP